METDISKLLKCVGGVVVPFSKWNGYYGRAVKLGLAIDSSGKALPFPSFLPSFRSTGMKNDIKCRLSLVLREESGSQQWIADTYKQVDTYE